MIKETTWTIESRSTITGLKRSLGNLAVAVREDQYKLFRKLIIPKVTDKVLDVGVSSEENIKGTNFFEKVYGNLGNLTLATIEDSEKLKKMYPVCRVTPVCSGKKLPFKDKDFDIVVSWATLEHVGGYKKQQAFMEELLRVGKKIFITTPYRGALYEPHTGFFFLHWLPISLFRKICELTGKKFWSTEDNLNPLWTQDLKKMRFKEKLKFKIYKTFFFLPSHIIITT